MAPQSFQLVMRAGPNPGKTFSLSKNDVIIGRDINTDIVINSAEVSRRHARLRLEGGGYVIEDLGSTNGTFVNGQRLTGRHLLRPGEAINLGEAVTLSFTVAQYDPNATVISSPSQVAQPPQKQAPPPEPVQRPVAPPPVQPPPAAYAGQVPAGPAPIAEAQPMDEEKGSRGWLWAGLGCLAIVLCVVVVGALAFDYFDFYCTPPFDMLFTCP
jgi:hypothetical protein